METPDKWVIVQRDGFLSVFAQWVGGYLDADSWRLSSRVEEIEDLGNEWLFRTFSGNEYLCRKNRQGTTTYGAAAVHGLKEFKGMEVVEDFVGFPNDQSHRSLPGARDDTKGDSE